MLRILVTLATRGDGLRSGSWSTFIVKTRGEERPIEFDRFTGNDGLARNSNNCFPLEIPNITNIDQIEYFEIQRISQESFPEDVDNWDAIVQVDLLSPIGPLGVGGPHRFNGANPNLRILRRRIALKTFDNAHFVGVSRGGGGSIDAERTALGRNETFTLIELGGDNVALLTADNAHFVGVSRGGGGGIDAERTALGRNETFTLIELGGDNIALQTADGEHFVGVSRGGGDSIDAERTAIGNNETFTLVSA